MDDDLAYLNLQRVRMGLRPLVLKKRECLACGEYFLSEGAHNRQCPLCKDKQRNETSCGNEGGK